LANRRVRLGSKTPLRGVGMAWVMFRFFYKLRSIS
jgi:hypothetical protein